MHIQHSFDLRVFAQSLKRIGTALKQVGASDPNRIATTDLPTEPAPHSAAITHADDQPEPHSQLHRAALLTRLAVELRAATAPALIAHNVLAALSQYSDAGAASIVLIDPDGAIELALSSSGRQPEPLPLEQTRRILARGPAGWDWRAGRSVLLANAAHELGWAGTDGAAPSGSVMVLPLACGSTTFGILAISHPLPGRFSSQDQLLLEGVAAQASLALGVERARQEERQQRGQPLARQDRQIAPNSDPMQIIFDHLPDGLVLIDPTGRILVANDAFCEDVLGIAPRAVIGQGHATILQELEQAEQIAIEPHPSIPALRRARCSGSDGRQRWYEIDRYGMAIGEGAEQVIERWRDITREEEQRRELLRDEHQTTMARMAAAVVHEIGNPLQSVRSCIDLSREDRTLAAPTAEYLDLASSELRRMSQILGQLRDLYRQPVSEANHE